MKSDIMRITDYDASGEMVLVKDKSTKPLCISELQNHIKFGENEEFKTKLANVRASDLVDVRGKTLLHTAAMFNNTEIIVFLLASKCNIDAITDHGYTPLMTAVKYNKFESVKVLLDANADIFIRNSTGKNTMQMLLESDKHVPEHVFVDLFSRLKRYGLRPEKIADVLINVGCTIDRVLLFNDAEVTRIMLDLTDMIGENEARTVMDHAMAYGNLDNVEVLLRYGVGANTRKRIFLNKLMCDSEDFSMRQFIEQLPEWNVIDEEFVHFLQRTFVSAEKHTIRMWLNYGIDEHVWEKFGIELAVKIFENPNVDPTCLLQKVRFTVDQRGSDGRTALHFAVMRNSEMCIRFLLERQTPCNVLDDFGDPPLFYAKNELSVDLLLGYGADPTLVNVEKRREVERDNDFFSELDFLLAHFAILEALGVLI